MKAMKSMGMNRMLGSLKRSPKDSNEENYRSSTRYSGSQCSKKYSIVTFCESGDPHGSGEEVGYLPAIVEAAESSPAAAKECAHQIRKLLSKENSSKPYIQYNAIMLIRILTENPGRPLRGIWIRNLQILMETLRTFTTEKADDETLAPLIEMWKKEQEKIARFAAPTGPAGPRTLVAPPFDPNEQNYFGRNHHTHRLPPPHELSSRIEEARTSAKLLSQVVQSTPPSELLANELVREFADRCQSASRSVQAYMVAENPGPDNDTMETLIDTNEQLSLAMNLHQRSVLHARKIMGLGNGETTTPPQVASSSSSSRSAPPIPPPGDFLPMGDDEENEILSMIPSQVLREFPDHPFPSDAPPKATGQFNDTLGVEPYHPGFKETKAM
ncbi:hypothetical protein DID88_003593 [Monilinia fructigena]|uniref:GAT domain-containing protein n=1 Tax=Monilinia fructigena TaxID=38457 RepID=A0A395IYY6_9HELO|nr:hypothetical protein DID88_003593 [Monilinia fructigena]